MDIEIYADEIITPIDYEGHTKNFLCIGCLFIPVEQKKDILSRFIDFRCLNKNNGKWSWNRENCTFKDTCKVDYHILNNCEIHNVNIRNSGASVSLKTISKKWLNHIIELNKKNTPIKFNILYVDLDKLNITQFGQEKSHENVYNRFFRTAINYGLKAFFNDVPKIVVKKVYHDNGSMINHDYFPYLNLMKLEENLSANTFVEDTDIHFLESNHRIYLDEGSELYSELYIESNVIQLADLMIGAITQNLYYLSDDSLKKEHAMIIRPLVERLTRKPNNNKSRYNYYRNQKISFFPLNKNEKTTDTVKGFEGQLIEIPKFDEFYSEKPLEMPAYIPSQKKISEWFS